MDHHHLHIDKYSLSNQSINRSNRNFDSGGYMRWESQQQQQTPTKDFNFSNELVQNLKKNYDERIKSLENQIKDTYQLIDQDEIINTMKLNHTTDEFRKQRIQELVEDSLLVEKEIQIDKLNQLNAYLKTELQQLEEEKNKFKVNILDEKAKYQKTIAELENALQKEVKMNRLLQEELDKSNQRVNQISLASEEFIKKKESQLLQQNQLLHANLLGIKQEYDESKAKYHEFEMQSEQKSKIIEELQRDLELYKKEYTQLEQNHNSTINEQINLAKALQATKESNVKLEQELRNLLEKCKKLEEDNEIMQINLENTIKEKNELINKTEYISAQIKKVVETEQKNSSEIAQSLKSKYKSKSSVFKKKNEELKQMNENLSNDIIQAKHQMEELKLNYEKIISNMQNDMKVIKNEWEKKVQEIDLNSQRQIAETKAKHQLQINQLQAEYQSLLDKKLNEIQSEANNQINKSKTLDIDLKTQLENRLNQLEKDYILKTKHENILTSQILEIKTKHAQAIKDTEEKYEKDVAERLKDITEKKKLEYEGVIATVKTANKSLEQTLAEIRTENRKILELLNQEKEKLITMTIELEEAQKNRKILMEHVEEANETISKLKHDYEELLKKDKRNDLEANEYQIKIEELNKRMMMNEESHQSLKEENSELLNQRVILEEKVDNLSRQLRQVQNENEKQKLFIESSKNEKKILEDQIHQLNEMMTKESQNYMEMIANIKKDEANKIEKESNEQMKLRGKLNQVEMRVKTLGNEKSELENKLNDITGQLNKAEEMIRQLEGHISDIERDKLIQENYHKEVIKKLEKNMQKHVENRQKIMRFMFGRISILKSELTSLRNSCQLEFQMQKKNIESIYYDLVGHLMTKISQLNHQHTQNTQKVVSNLTQEYQLKIRDVEMAHLEEKLHDQNEYDKAMQAQIQGYEKLMQEFEAVKLESAKNKEVIDELKTNLNTMKGKAERFESEKKQLEAQLDLKVAEFENMQQHVKREINRIKDESQQIVQETAYKLEEKHRKELMVMQNSLDELKYNNISRLQRLDAEISKLHNVANNDISQLKTFYEFKIDNYEKELDLMENEWNILKKEKKVLKLEIEKLNENLKRLLSDHQKTISSFEEKIEHLKDIMKRDGEKYAQNKGQNTMDNEKLRNEIKSLIRENSSQSDKITELTKIKDELKNEITRLKAQLDQKDKQVETQQKEVSKISKYRDREIEELQTLLARSLQSIGTSIENNNKIMTNKTDKVTEDNSKTLKMTNPKASKEFNRPIMNVIDHDKIMISPKKDKNIEHYYKKKI